jgi:hypothetical protein
VRKLKGFSVILRNRYLKARYGSSSAVVLRPVWEAVDLGGVSRPDQGELVDLEKRLLSETSEIIASAKHAFNDGFTYSIESLLEAARTDLVAGCALAHAGYLKQAYSLWRSWFEQSIFAAYFIESPIHSAAWVVNERVEISDSPKVRLMLHQLLADSGEPHPFAVVYADRFDSVLGHLKVSVPKEQRLIRRASRVLTMLSQGVHGTFRPSVKRNSDLVRQLADGMSALRTAAKVLAQFWCCLLVVKLDATPEELVELRGTRQEGVNMRPGLHELSRSFARGFEVTNG